LFSSDFSFCGRVRHPLHRRGQGDFKFPDSRDGSFNASDKLPD
jgi:hypothetical protein